MPRFRVIERRAFKSGVLIDAATEDDAKILNGDIIDEAETDSWGDEILEVEEVSEDTDHLGDL